jgi:glycine oxidase
VPGPTGKIRVDEARSDVLIVGAGLIGAAIAWLLSKARCRVVLIDAGRLGGEASAAGAGMLAPGGEYRKPSRAAHFALESLTTYPAFVRELENESGTEIDFRHCGAIELAYDVDRWQALKERAALQRRFGICVDSICPSSLSSLAPGVNQTGIHGALFYPKDACVAPTDLLRALRIVCERRGVTILENAPVQRIRSEQGKVTAHLGCVRITGGKLVLAAGAWSSLVPIDHCGEAVRLPASFPVKGHIVGYQLPAGSLRPILRHGHHYVLQRKNGFTLAGSSEERCGFNRDPNAEQIREIRAGVGSFYSPIASTEPAKEWIGFRPGIEQGEPALSRVPGTDVWLAYGHYRNGILLTPATAHLLASAILADRPEFQLLDAM